MLGQRERGWREVGKKEVRKVEEMRVWREEEEVRRSWREGCGEGFDWGDGGGGRKVDRILKKRKVETMRWVGDRENVGRRLAGLESSLSS